MNIYTVNSAPPTAMPLLALGAVDTVPKASHSASQPHPESANQQIDQATNNLTSKRATQSANQPLSQPANNSAGQPLAHSANKPLNQAINHSTDQPTTPPGKPHRGQATETVGKR